MELKTPSNKGRESEIVNIQEWCTIKDDWPAFYAYAL